MLSHDMSWGRLASARCASDEVHFLAAGARKPIWFSCKAVVVCLPAWPHSSKKEERASNNGNPTPHAQPEAVITAVLDLLRLGGDFVEANKTEERVGILLLFGRSNDLQDEVLEHLPHKETEERCQCDERKNVERELGEFAPAIVHKHQDEGCFSDEAVEERLGDNADFFGEVADGLSCFGSCFSPATHFGAVDVLNCLQDCGCIGLLFRHLIGDGLNGRLLFLGQAGNIDRGLLALGKRQRGKQGENNR